MAFIARQDAAAGVSAATLSINVPTHSAGDLMLAFMGGQDDGNGPVGTNRPSPTDGNDAWSYLEGNSVGASSTGANLHGFFRVASDNEPSAYVWTWASATRLVGSIVTYSGSLATFYHADKVNTGNDASGSKTTTITSHTKTFTDATFVYAEMALSAGAFDTLVMTVDGATTDRGTTFANANIAALSIGDEAITGTTIEPARSWVDTWIEHGGGHTSTLIRAVVIGAAVAAAGDAWAYMS